MISWIFAKEWKTRDENLEPHGLDAKERTVLLPEMFGTGHFYLAEGWATSRVYESMERGVAKQQDCKSKAAQDKARIRALFACHSGELWARQLWSEAEESGVEWECRRQPTPAAVIPTVAIKEATRVAMPSESTRIGNE